MYITTNVDNSTGSVIMYYIANILLTLSVSSNIPFQYMLWKDTSSQNLTPSPMNNTHKYFTVNRVLYAAYCISHIYIRILSKKTEKKNKRRGLSPQANYTDRATAACRRS
jgi:hypothetical protein